MGLNEPLLGKLTDFDLSDHIPTYSLAQAAPFFWLSFLSSWAVCHLVHQHADTRLLRMALWPIAVASNLWAVLTVDMSGRTSVWAIVGLVLFNATSSAIRWGLASSPPTYNPLPQQPYWPRLRQSTPIKALNLIFDEPRLLSVAGTPPPLRRSPKSVIQHLLHHLIQFFIALLSIDILTYPLYHLDPTNIGHPFTLTADWDRGIRTIATRSNLPSAVVVPALILGASLVPYLGMSLVWHPAAMLGIGSGIWVPEEWPKVMDKPWKAESLNELWGKRYHQMLRNSFDNYSRFLSFLPRNLAIFRIFLMSAIYHILVYHPHHRVYKIYHFSLMFLLTGLGLELERQFYRTTGKRVSGWSGRIWTWGWFTFCGYFFVRGVAEIGWLGGIRAAFAQDRRMSVVEWTLYFAGVRPHPSLPVSL